MIHGSYYVTLILLSIILLVFPCVVTSLFIGVRFQGHLNKFYMGFIGLTILYYIQAALASTDMLNFSTLYFRQALESLVIYYPTNERCLKYSTNHLNFTHTIGKTIVRIFCKHPQCFYAPSYKLYFVIHHLTM